jgi:hypothetical protein
MGNSRVSPRYSYLARARSGVVLFAAACYEKAHTPLPVTKMDYRRIRGHRARLGIQRPLSSAHKTRAALILLNVDISAVVAASTDNRPHNRVKPAYNDWATLLISQIFNAPGSHVALVYALLSQTHQVPMR